MAKGAMAYIVQQNGHAGTFCFFVTYLHPFSAQHINGSHHQVQGTQCMMKPGVSGAGVDKFGESQLPYTAQTLEPGMANDIENERRWNGKKPIHRIVN